MSELQYLSSRGLKTSEFLRELWSFREVLYVLVARDIKVRYRQAIIGGLWAILQPLGMMLVFSWLFTRVNATPTETGSPYALSAYLGLLGWQVFAYSIREGAGALIINRNLVTKVYFPRLILPLSNVICAIFDFMVASPLLLVFLVYYDVSASWTVAAGVFFFIWIVIWSFACAIWISALNALYRDIGHVVPFLIQLGMIATPVLYETTQFVSPKWYVIWGLNPMVGAIEGMRWSVIHTQWPPMTLLMPGISVTMVVLVTGVVFFRRTEQWIADRV